MCCTSDQNVFVRKIIVARRMGRNRRRKPRMSWLKRIKYMGKERGKIMGEIKLLR